MNFSANAQPLVSCLSSRGLGICYNTDESKENQTEYRKGTVNMARAKWYELDNNAKIVPSTTKGSDTRVFRITCELKEEVNGALLQHALDRTVPDFPHFASVLRKGLFWYYLDSSNIHAVVQQENKPACAPIYWDGRRRLLYRVNYYRRRINLEMFHVLTDGTGAFDFLRAIVCNYLKLAHSLDEESITVMRQKEGRRNRKRFPAGLIIFKGSATNICRCT